MYAATQERPCLLQKIVKPHSAFIPVAWLHTKDNISYISLWASMLLSFLAVGEHRLLMLRLWVMWVMK